MKIIMKLCIGFVFCFPIAALADGPSIDAQGNPTAPCVELKISQSQGRELNIKRFVTLTRSQMKAIGPQWETAALGILSEGWRDCTCGMLYAFWTGPNEISIPKDMISYEREIRRVQNSDRKESEVESWDLLGYLKTAVIMDAEGQFYRNGTRVTISALSAEYKKTRKPVVINVPSVKILEKKKRDVYLKKLNEAGIVFRIFG